MRYIDLHTREGRQAFYSSTEWRTLRLIKLSNDPLCEICLKTDKLVPASEVHHIKDIEDDPTYENATNYEGLQSLCKSCHSSITLERFKEKKREKWRPFRLS